MQYLDDQRTSGTSMPNIVSLIDVFLFILLAQMAGTAGTSQELPVELAEVRSAAASERPSEFFKVTVTADGAYRAWGKPTDVADLRARIAGLRPGTVVAIEADRDARHSAVASILSAAHEAQLRCVVQVHEERQP